MHGYEMEPRLLIGTLLLASLPYDCFSFELYFIIIIAAAEHDIEQASVIKVAFHDTDTDILARILADTSDTRDFLKLFLRQPERGSRPTRRHQGRSDGGYIGIYIPQNQSTLQIFMWLLVVFFLFDPGQIVVDFEIGRTS